MTNNLPYKQIIFKLHISQHEKNMGPSMGVHLKKKNIFAPGGVHLVRTSHVLIDLGERSQDVQVEDQDGSRDQDLATVETWKY